MEIPSMENVLILAVHHRIVVHGVQLPDHHFFGIANRIPNRPQYLGDAAKGIGFLYFFRYDRFGDLTAVKVILPSLEHSRSLGQGSNPSGNLPLAWVEFGLIQLLGKRISEYFHDLVEHKGDQRGPANQLMAIMEIHGPDPGHGRSAIE